MDSSPVAFSWWQKLLVSLCLVWVVGCYCSLCMLTAFLAAGGDPVAIAIALTPTVTETRFKTPLPTYTPYPTSTRTRVPTETPIFPDYFFPTKTPTPTLTPTPEDTATLTPMPTATSLPATPLPAPTIAPVNTPAPIPTAALYAGCTCESDNLNCGNFSGRAAAQQCYDHCRSPGSEDIYGLDGDNNGLACDGYDGSWNIPVK